MPPSTCCIHFRLAQNIVIIHPSTLWIAGINTYNEQLKTLDNTPIPFSKVGKQICCVCSTLHISGLIQETEVPKHRHTHTLIYGTITAKPAQTS